MDCGRYISEVLPKPYLYNDTTNHTKSAWTAWPSFEVLKFGRFRKEGREQCSLTEWISPHSRCKDTTFSSHTQIKITKMLSFRTHSVVILTTFPKFNPLIKRYLHKIPIYLIYVLYWIVYFDSIPLQIFERSFSTVCPHKSLCTPYLSIVPYFIVCLARAWWWVQIFGVTAWVRHEYLPHRYGCHPRWYSPVFPALSVCFVAWFFSLHFLCISLKHNRLQMYYACACLFLISCHVLGRCAFGKRENRLIIAPSSSEETANFDRLNKHTRQGQEPNCTLSLRVVQFGGLWQIGNEQVQAAKDGSPHKAVLYPDGIGMFAV